MDLGGKSPSDLMYRFYCVALLVSTTSSVTKTEQGYFFEKTSSLPETWPETVPEISGWQISKGAR